MDIHSSYNQKLIVTCSDGIELVGDLLLPLTNEYRAFVQLNGAMGVRKEFYLPFAQYLASLGFVVYVFDYRGMGESKVGNLRNHKGLLSDWGRLDMAAVLDFGHKAFPTLPKFVIGHSMGGQLLGLMPNHYLLKGAVMVAVSSGYWRLQAWPSMLRSLFFFNALVPLTSSLVGYVAAKSLGIMEDLPRGVGLEWRKWCHSPQYLFDFVDPRDNFYGEIRFSLLNYLFSDDPLATPRSSEALLKHFSRALTEQRHVSPAQVGQKQIGHFGFFSRRSESTLWPQVAEYLGSLAEQHKDTQSSNSKNSAFGKGLKT